ncbi:MAG: hypothetical protein FWG11_04275 [Promicromonosporaceae bacterium]|nr:hypothetical protein [Promicromonosporaceae bacterium]
MHGTQPPGHTGPLELREVVETAAATPSLPSRREAHGRQEAGRRPALPILPEPEPDPYLARHLLALPAGMTSDELFHLAAARFSAARWAVVPDDQPKSAAVLAPTDETSSLPRLAAPGEPGEMRLTRHSRLTGPYAPPSALSVVSGSTVAPDLPAEFSQLWRLTCPRERWPDPPLPTEPLAAAFPAGLPNREEERVTTWLLDVARRCVSAAQLDRLVLRPDPGTAVDLTLYSGVWLDPNACQRVARSVEPTAALATSGVEYAGPSAEATAPAVSPAAAAALGQEHAADLGDPLARAKAQLGTGLLAAVHAAADEVDHRAVQAPHVLDGYAVHLEHPAAGLVAIEVMGDDDLPPALHGKDWGSAGAIAYRVRWEPKDPADRWHEYPAEPAAARRSAATALVAQIAHALWATTGGEILDAADFPVAPGALSRDALGEKATGGPPRG